MIGTYARNPVEFVRGQGTVLWDADGNEYLDFLAGISVVQVGHCHPALVEAVTEQASRLMHVGNLYYTEPAMTLAGRLSDLALGGKAFFCNSGTEAIECAIKLARRHRPQGEFVVMERGFHGRTMGALSATPQEAKQAPFAPLVPGFHVVAHDDAEGLAAAVDGQTAAVLIEPVQGEGGIHVLSDATLAAARAACDEHGAMLIFDEIQCGMGRTGDWWGWQRAGVLPDAMTVAKGLGGGLPIGACLTSPRFADVLQPGDHGSTFAGGPVIAAGANAVLDVISQDGFLADVATKGARLAAALTDHGLDVRGRGLMLAFAAADAPTLARRLLTEQRLVVNATGPDTIRLLPPLTVSEDEIDEAAARIGALVASRLRIHRRARRRFGVHCRDDQAHIRRNSQSPDGTASPADAAFPGANGRIVYDDDLSSGFYTVSPNGSGRAQILAGEAPAPTLRGTHPTAGWWSTAATSTCGSWARRAAPRSRSRPGATTTRRRRSRPTGASSCFGARRPTICSS